MTNRIQALSDIYIDFHGLTRQGNYEVHHIIPFSEKNHNVKQAYLDSLPNLIRIDKDLHEELTRGINRGERYFEIEFHNDYQTVSFKNILEPYHYFSFNGQTVFQNGNLVTYDANLAPFIERYNHWLLIYNSNQLKRK